MFSADTFKYLRNIFNEPFISELITNPLDNLYNPLHILLPDGLYKLSVLLYSGIKSLLKKNTLDV